MPLERPTSFALYPAEHPAIAATSVAQLKKERERLMENLLHAEDLPGFMYRKGEIRGIEKAIDVCENIEKELNKR
jgi:hypothetical protein